MLNMAFLVDTVGLVPSTYPHFQWLVYGFIGLALRERYNPLFVDSKIPNVVDAPVIERETRILSRKKTTD